MANTITFPISIVGATSPVKKTFRTARTGADRVSQPVTMLNCIFDPKTRQIKVLCSDNKLRTCNIDRLPDVETGRALWTSLREYGTLGINVQFTAAGGFNPDTWFYKVEPAIDFSV